MCAQFSSETEVEPMDHWRLCDEISVIEAALLIIGEDPATRQELIFQWTDPKGYVASFTALKNAILAGRLQATIRRSTRQRGWQEDPSDGESVGKDDRGLQIIHKDEPDWKITTVQVEALRTWLRSRGIKTGFFFPKDMVASPDYLNPSDPHYAPKLAAAIGAWQAVKNDPLRAKTAKKVLATYLLGHASEYGLTKEDGSINKQAIEEVSKVANWDRKGGAPKTLGE